MGVDDLVRYVDERATRAFRAFMSPKPEQWTPEFFKQFISEPFELPANDRSGCYLLMAYDGKTKIMYTGESCSLGQRFVEHLYQAGTSKKAQPVHLEMKRRNVLPEFIRTARVQHANDLGTRELFETFQVFGVGCMQAGNKSYLADMGFAVTLPENFVAGNHQIPLTMRNFDPEAPSEWTAREWVCRLCHEPMQNYQATKKHTRGVHDTKIYLCPQVDCDFPADGLKSVALHLTKHTGARDYRCPDCHKGCSRQDGTDVHIQNGCPAIEDQF